MIKERGYVGEIEELFEPFFALHPTKDLNELFAKITKERSGIWDISTSIRTIQKGGRLWEGIELALNLRNNRILGKYIVDYYNHPGSEKTFDERKCSCSIELTATGVGMREDVLTIEEDRGNLENFKFLVQLLDLSKDKREGLKLTMVSFSEKPSFREGEGKNFKYDLEYEIDADHELMETLGANFDIEDALKCENAKLNIQFLGSYTADESDEKAIRSMQEIRIRIGDFEEEGSVNIVQKICYHSAT